MLKEKLISIHLNSNKPESFKKFIISLADNSNDIEAIEVLVSIDVGDEKIQDMIKNLNYKYPNLIRTIKTNLIRTFADAWKPLNILLKETSKSVKFISCMSDEIIFKTKNWDSLILKYDSFFSDNIFRIRCSKNKNKIYKDIWECGYKPDSYAFYTKKWLDLVGQWNPCIGPDTFQECISFYMNKYGEKYKRNIIAEDIYFDGEIVSLGMPFKDRIKRSRIYYKAFFILMSYKTQKIANISAFKIISEINGLNKLPVFLSINRNKLYWKNFFVVSITINNNIFFIFAYIGGILDK